MGKFLKIDSSKIPFTITAILGLGILSIIATALSLVIRINIEAQALLILLSLFLVFYLQRNKSLSPFTKKMVFNRYVFLILVLVSASILELATHVPSNSDSGLYHAQVIHWTENYAAVPGLGNIHARLALNSSWFVLTALFSFSFLNLHSLHLTSSVLFLLFTGFCLSALPEWRTHGGNTSRLIRIILLPFSFNIFGSEISSPGTDLPATLLTWLVIILFMEAVERNSQSDDIHYIIAMMMAAVAVTVKLSAAPLIILLIFQAIFLLKSKKYAVLIKLGIILIILVLPWLIRNIILSGYPLFPQTSLDFFNFDWKIPSKEGKSIEDYVVAWSRIRNTMPEDTLALPFNVWFGIWLQSRTIFQKIYLVVLLIQLIFIFLAIILPTKIFSAYKSLFKKQWFILIATLLGVLYWFLKAPNFRYGTGFFFGLLFTCFSFIIIVLINIIKRKSFATIAAVALIGIFVFITYNSIDINSISDRIIRPADYPIYPSEPCYMGKALMFCSQYYMECWYRPFPCVPFGRINVVMRGDSFQQGFRVITESQ